MAWSVYAIHSLVRNYVYVGLTSDLPNRIARHNAGRERTTRSYRPFAVIHSESFETRGEARKEEVYLKSGCGREFLKNLIASQRSRISGTQSD
jgi:putative endonuclease